MKNEGLRLIDVWNEDEKAALFGAETSLFAAVADMLCAKPTYPTAAAVRDETH